jgi:hypothetical protein
MGVGGGGGGSPGRGEAGGELVEQDAEAGVSELVAGATILTTAKYDDEYAKGSAHVRKARALDLSGESVPWKTLFEMVNDKEKLKSVELRVEASVVLRRLNPTVRNARAAQELVTDCMQLGDELLAGLDEGLLSFCLPQFSFLWRTPIRGTHSSAE